MGLFRKLMATNAPAAVILIRVRVGWVFLSEGMQDGWNATVHTPLLNFAIN